MNADEPHLGHFAGWAMGMAVVYSRVWVYNVAALLTRTENQFRKRHMVLPQGCVNSRTMNSSGRTGAKPTWNRTMLRSIRSGVVVWSSHRQK